MSAEIKSAEDIRGFEYDWLASDDRGFVALFSTAGAGYVPAAVLRDGNAHTIALELILSMPASTTACFSPVLGAGCDNTWKQVAERGFYAYDCDPNGGPYHLVAKPEIPVSVHSLPPVASALCTVVHLRLRFDELPLIHAQMIAED